MKLFKISLLPLLLTFSIFGCLSVPHAPSRAFLKSTEELREGVSLHHMNKDATGLAHRNLIFIAADDESEKVYTGYLKKVYPLRATPRLEEVAWWLYAGDIRDAYDDVIRIRYDRFSTENLEFALKVMEQRGVPYDLTLLTHGVPNNVVTSVGYPLFSWQELDRLEGKLKHLRLLFMQGCYGTSLVADWERAGAKVVLSYPDLNRNFFFYGFFLPQLRIHQENAALAYRITATTIAGNIRASAFYTRLIAALGATVDEYLQVSPNPNFDAVSAPAAP